MPFTVATQKDWLRGVNAATGKATVVQGTVRRVSNFLYTQRGSLITVDGTKIVVDGSGNDSTGSTIQWSTGSNGAFATPVAMIAANRSPAAPFPLVVALDYTGVWRAYDFSTKPITPAFSLGGLTAAGVGVGGVAFITVTSPGAGYTAATQVLIAGGSPGTGFVGSVTVAAGQVTAVTVIANGSGYTSVPKVFFVDPGGGTGAVANATMFGSGSGGRQWGGLLPYTPGKVPIGIYRLPQLVNVNNLVVLCPGNDGIPVWANFFLGTQGVVGSNPSYLPVTGAAHGILHQGFLWLWNTGQTIGTTDSPSTLRMCELGSNGIPDVTIFPQVNAAFVDANDGTQGQGMATFTSAASGISPTATLVLFKDYTTYQVTGLLRPGGGYAVTKAQTEMGCVAPRSIQFAPGFGIIRLTHLGVAVFDGTNDKLISEEVRPYIFQSQPDIQAIDSERWQFCKATIITNPPMYALAVPLPNILGNSRMLCYDLIMKQWTIVDLPAASSSALGPIQLIETLKIPGKKPITYVSDFAALDNNFIHVTKPPSQGQIRKWMDGDQTWDGVPIAWFVQPPALFSKNPSTYLYARRNILRAKSPASPITCSYETDGVKYKAPTLTKSFVPLSNPSLYNSSARYNSASVYGGNYDDLVLSFDVGVKASSISPRYAGTGPVELLATDWHYMEKPLGFFGRIS